ncbi:wd repeat-containing protein [Anaeramoeba flamelloides]|uniref:Wd repeat-containing protein n=1 Tax=Anaeramoeba flamelloides TaxID=1746091 RepID=A0AAV7YYD2_9EUKA|nr:wd repeat-containing protein [Anaeramoeba flamelloides]
MKFYFNFIKLKKNPITNRSEKRKEKQKNKEKKKDRGEKKRKESEIKICIEENDELTEENEKTQNNVYNNDYDSGYEKDEENYGDGSCNDDEGDNDDYGLIEKQKIGIEIYKENLSDEVIKKGKNEKTLNLTEKVAELFITGQVEEALRQTMKANDQKLLLGICSRLNHFKITKILSTEILICLLFKLCENIFWEMEIKVKWIIAIIRQLFLKNISRKYITFVSNYLEKFKQTLFNVLKNTKSPSIITISDLYDLLNVIYKFQKPLEFNIAFFISFSIFKHR